MVMKPSTRSVLKPLLKGLAGLFLGVGGMAFWFGGGLIHATVGTDRILAEIEGCALAVACFGISGAAKLAEDRLEEDELGTSKSLGEVLRK
jgi:TctA family transporter